MNRWQRPLPAAVALLAIGSLPAFAAQPAAARPARGTVALDAADCAEISEMALRTIVSVEIGDLLAPRGGDPPPDGYRLVARCGGGVAHLEAQSVARSDGLVRTLRLDDFPGDAAPRAVALAGLEMLAALDPVVRARVDAKPPSLRQPARFGFALAGVRRTFSGVGGAAGWGGRLGADRRRGSWILAADLEVDHASSTQSLGETRALLTSLGAFGGVTVGGGRFAGALVGGMRAGLVWLSGEPAPGAGVTGGSVTRPWFGPALAATASAGGARIGAMVSVEAGWVVRGAQGLAGGVTVIAVAGGWLMVSAGVRF